MHYGMSYTQIFMEKKENIDFRVLALIHLYVYVQVTLQLQYYVPSSVILMYSKVRNLLILLTPWCKKIQ